jgi:hypothetical protein
MDIAELDFNEIEKLSYNSHCFNDIRFIKHVSHKTEEIKFLVFKNSKNKLAIIFGSDKNKLASPFSAPFGGFIQFNSKISIEEIDCSINLLNNWFVLNNIISAEITLPPLAYNTTFISKVENSLLRNNFKLKKNELNYHFNLDDFNSGNFIESNMLRNARKNLNISLKNNLNFRKVNDSENEKVYNIIRQNRDEHGYELKLTYNEIINTGNLIEIEYFIVEFVSIAIAAAIVYKIQEGIMQVVYWGGIEEYQHHKPINFLSYKLLEYYSLKNIKIIDIGPSSISSIPDYGLCDFKDSIGCQVSLKKTFIYEKNSKTI